MPSTDNLISRVDHAVANTTMRQQLRDQLIVAMVGATASTDGNRYAYNAPAFDKTVVAVANRLAMAAYPEDPA